MKVATVTLKISNLGSCITKYNVTPAELLILVADFHPHVGGDPVIKLKEEVTKMQRHNDEHQVVELLDPKTKTMKAVLISPPWAEDSWTAQQEANRLRGNYYRARVNGLFPGRIPTLPTTFEEARAAGVDAESPTPTLVSSTEGGHRESLVGATPV